MDVRTTDSNTEKLVLSMILHGVKHDVSKIFEDVKADDFFYKGHREFFNVLAQAYFNNENISTFSLLKLHPEIAKIKMESTPIELELMYSQIETMRNTSEGMKGHEAETLIKSLKRTKKLRGLRDLATNINAAIEKGYTPEKIYESIERSVMDGTQETMKRTLLTPKDMAKLMIESVADRMDEEKRKKNVMYTSFKTLNYYSGGFERGNMIILSAGSGVGKSAFSMNLSHDIAYGDGKTVLYINSELTDDQQALRYAALLTGIPHNELRNGMNDGDGTKFGSVLDAAEIFKNKNIYTATIPDLQIANVVSEIRRMVEFYGVDMVVVDYIGRMDSSNADRQEWQIMEQAARTLKTAAVRFNIVVIMVAQLSSNGESLAKGASMKNECDLWLNLKKISNQDRAAYEQFKHEQLPPYWNTLIEFKKARNVAVGTVLKMHFHGESLTYTDDEKRAQEFYDEEQAEINGGML